MKNIVFVFCIFLLFFILGSWVEGSSHSFEDEDEDEGCDPDTSPCHNDTSTVTVSTTEEYCCYEYGSDVPNIGAILGWMFGVPFAIFCIFLVILLYRTFRSYKSVQNDSNQQRLTPATPNITYTPPQPLLDDNRAIQRQEVYVGFIIPTDYDPPPYGAVADRSEKDQNKVAIDMVEPPPPYNPETMGK